MGFTISLRVADMVDGVRVLVAFEGMGAALMELELEVLGWVLDWVKGEGRWDSCGSLESGVRSW